MRCAEDDLLALARAVGVIRRPRWWDDDGLVAALPLIMCAWSLVVAAL